MSVTRDSIFDGIDDLPWAEVEHCFGPAVDTPGHLWNLRSPSVNDRHEAWQELITSIYHLGDRFPASSLAVPFLMRLALAPDTPDRDGVIGFLMDLAIGHDTEHFPAGFDVDSQRQQLTVLRAHTAESWERHVDEWVAAEPDDRRRERRIRHRKYYTLSGSISGTESAVRAYEAVRAGIPELRRLLHDEDPGVRAATAYLLAWFPEDAVESTAALATLLATETAVPVVINAMIALGLLKSVSTTVLTPYLGSPDQPIAWAAAVALVCADVADQVVIARLGDALRCPPRDKFGLLYRYGDFGTCASRCLASITGTMAPFALDVAIAAFTPHSNTQMWAAAPAAVALAFPESSDTSRPAFADLEPQQQRVLRELVQAGPGPWRLNNKLDLLLTRHNMPRFWPELLAYVEGTSP